MDEIDDSGFGLLTGSPAAPPAYTAQSSVPGGNICCGMKSIASAIAPVLGTCCTDEDSLLSFDEHSIPRWTKKFSIRKGYVTTRNKYMRCEKLYYGYDLRQRRFVTVKATPGNVELRDVSGLLVRRVLRSASPLRYTPCSMPGPARATRTCVAC